VWSQWSEGGKVVKLADWRVRLWEGKMRQNSRGDRQRERALTQRGWVVRWVLELNATGQDAIFPSDICGRKRGRERERIWMR
jgi:G:T-mismatch repair DNA endonuclease (very short patch repair protein)